MYDECVALPGVLRLLNLEFAGSMAGEAGSGKKYIVSDAGTCTATRVLSHLQFENMKSSGRQGLGYHGC